MEDLSLTEMSLPEGTEISSGRDTDGEYHEVKFPNGFGASIIRTMGSYGGSRGLFELMTLNKITGLNTWEQTKIKGISEIEGWLSREDVEEILIKLADLPDRP